MAKTRNITFDLMKGVTILLMMIVHLVCRDTGSFTHFCNSFHMPLFFILAGLFAKDVNAIPSFKQYTIKNAKRLLLPLYVTMLFRVAWGGFQAYLKHDISYLLQPTLSMLVASPDGWETQWGLVYTGPMWFLVALFWIREFFYGLQLALNNLDPKYRDLGILGISIVLSIIAVIVYPHIAPFPFGLTQAFTSMAFYALGYYVYRHPFPKWVYALSVLVWPFAIHYGSVSLAFCTIDYYPLSFIGACGGTYVIYLLCKGWSKVLSYISSLNIKHATVNFTSPLTWCGVNSLAILCMHELELYSGFLYSIICRVPQAAYLVGWGEILIAIVMALIVLNMPVLKKVYK